ncbi:MAG: DNA primase [Proteobacteria bacterium]|nr:DNA primase [Pseudomonadota bacterium]
MANNIKFSQRDLEMITQRLSLVDFVGKRVPLKRRGHDFWGCCPFHGEKTPSFHVRDDKKYYHCFGCGVHGNIFDFCMFTRGGNFPEAVEYLADMAGVKLETTYTSPKDKKEYTDSLKALDFSTKLYQSRFKQAERSKNYIKSRGLKKETIETFKIGYARDSWNDLRDTLTQKGISQKALINNGMVVKSDKGGYDRFRDRIMFPIENYKGQTIAFGGRILDKGEPKYLNSPETTLFNKRYNLYGLNINQEFIRKENKVFIVEGYMDVIALYDKGVKLAVAPLGTAITKEQILTLWKYNSNPIVCLDGDGAGQKASSRLARIILSELQPGRTLQFMIIPEDEDPDSYITKYGSDAFMKLSNNTVSIVKCIWSEIIKDKNPKNPDDVAVVRQEITTLISQIVDKNVKSQYGRTFNDLLWNFTNSKKARHSPNAQITDNKKGAQLSKNKLISKARTEESLLLALTLQYPEQTLVFEEQFAEIIFSDLEYVIIKKALFDFLEQETLDKQVLNNYLNNMNLTESTNRVLKSCEGILANELKNVNNQEITTYWQKLYQQLQINNSSRNRSNNNILSDQSSRDENYDSNFMENLTKQIKKGK